MTIRLHDLGYTGHLQPASNSGEILHLVKARGRAMQLEVPAGWHSVWMPLSRGLRVSSQETTWNLASRDLLVWHEGGLRNSGGQPSWFLALCGPAGAFRSCLPTPADDPFGLGSLLPTHAPCPREVRRLFVRLARLLGRADAVDGAVQQVAAALCSAIAESQAATHAYLERCSGRTAQRRQHTLLRLLRVHHLISNNTDGRFDLLHLSRVANFSPWHLTRTYRDVFGETPTEYAVRLRLQRAMQLVRGSTLTVGEITEALGFESQSTFCRSFKKAYGVTTTQARG